MSIEPERMGRLGLSWRKRDVKCAATRRKGFLTG